MDYITLMGAEGVQQAGRDMANAAESFSQSVSYISDILREHTRSMEDLVYRLEALEPNPLDIPE